MKRILISVFLVISGINPVLAFTDEQAIKSIIGEAENQGYLGMFYVACAIRNRGTLKGVYGLHAPRVKAKLYSGVTWDYASTAWKHSLTSDECSDIDGATNWENVKAFGLPYWAKGMKETLTYKDHRFFRKGIR